MMKRRCMNLGLVALVVAAVAMQSSAQGADLKRGALLFQTCAACHSVLGTGVAPDLTGIVGQKAASRPGFDYSAAMRSSGLTWNVDTLRRFIRNPSQLVPGTRMNFPGYPAPADVDDVIAYLQTLN